MAWEVKKLGDVCEFINGKAHEKIISEDGKYIVINSKFISSDGEIYKKTDKQLMPLLKGDLVFVMSDVPKGKALAKFFLVDLDNTYTLNQRIGLIRNNTINKKFLYYQLNRNQYFINFDNGENQTNLRKKDILNCPLLIPPLPIQKKIVEVLDSAFEKIAKAKENSEANLNNAKEVFESYLQKVFENKGEDWEEKELSEIAKIQTGTTPKTSEKENIGNFIPFIKPADFNKDGSLNYDNFGLSEKGLKQSRLIEKNSVLMVCIGATIGKTGFTERNISCNQQINSLTLRKDLFPKLFYYALITKKFQSEVLNNSGQATLPIINKSKWSKLKISYPKLIEEQKLIVSKLDNISEQTKQLESVYSKKLSSLEELKQSILQKAFKGELTEVSS